MRSLALLSAGLLLAVSAHAGAQQANAIPQSPAFTFLDISPTKVERPTTAREFGAALQNGIDESGKVLQGLALEAAPWTWLPGVSIPPDKYRQTGAYMLANLSLSLGTARAAGDTASTNLALGLRTTVYDDSDPMRDPALVQGLRQALVKCNSAYPADVDDAVLRACAAQANQQRRKDWLAKHWNEGSLSFAVAGGTRLTKSQFDSVGFLGVSGWGAWAMRLASSGQLLVQGRVDHRAALDTAAAFTSLRLGARAVFGSENANGFLELEHNSKASSGRGARTGWSGGVEFRASDDLWISTGFGKGYTSADNSKVVVLANISWRVSGKSSMAPH